MPHQTRTDYTKLDDCIVLESRTGTVQNRIERMAELAFEHRLPVYSVFNGSGLVFNYGDDPDYVAIEFRRALKIRDCNKSHGW